MTPAEKLGLFLQGFVFLDTYTDPTTIDPKAYEEWEDPYQLWAETVRNTLSDYQAFFDAEVTSPTKEQSDLYNAGVAVLADCDSLTEYTPEALQTLVPNIRALQVAAQALI